VSEAGKVGDKISAANANWSFGGNVSDTFDEHVSRSVPLYREGHDLVVEVADFFLSDGSVCYELGCSTAALTIKLAEANKGKDVRFIGVDVEEGMVRKAREKCQGYPNVELLEADLVDMELEKADLIVAYYTMQFIKPRNRQLIFDRIYEALNWGGAFVCFEKVRAPDARFQDICSAIYTDYKLHQQYNPDEIVSKSRSLKGVLEPFSTQGNIDLMTRAGFVDIMTIQKYVCFEGYLAIK
jgi:tRNA (cmo5U34)-methyltransferase